MGLSLRPGFLRRGSDEITPTTDDTPVAVNTTANADKDGTTIPLDDALKADQEVPSEDAQNGVRDIEAVTLAWTKKSLISVLISVWFVYLLNAFQSSTAGNLVPYVTSDWGEHSLMTVVDVVASSMTAAVFIPLAKFLDLWGRAEGFLVMAAFSELGLILMATSKNLSTYCAANVSQCQKKSYPEEAAVV